VTTLYSILFIYYKHRRQ